MGGALAHAENAFVAETKRVFEAAVTTFGGTSDACCIICWLAKEGEETPAHASLDLLDCPQRHWACWGEPVGKYGTAAFRERFPYPNARKVSEPTSTAKAED